MSALDPRIEVLVRSLRHNAIDFSIRNIRTGSASPDGPGDRFTLIVPYCGSELKWDVVLNHRNLNVPPDFILESDDWDCPISSVPSLLRWDLRNVNALADVVLEMRRVYRSYQHQRVVERLSDAMRIEYDTLTQFKDSEVFLSDGDNPQLRCLIPLDVQLTLDFVDTRGLYLYIAYFVSSSRSPETHLTYPASLQDLFVDIQLPPFTSSTLLMDYKPMVEDLITRRADSLRSSYDARRRLSLALEKEFNQVVEHDSLFTRISCILNSFHDKSPALLHVSPGNSFPGKDAPSVTIVLLTGEKFMSGSRPVTKILTSLPWSPRWTPEDIAKRIKAYATSPTVVSEIARLYQDS